MTQPFQSKAQDFNTSKLTKHPKKTGILVSTKHLQTRVMPRLFNTHSNRWSTSKTNEARGEQRQRQYVCYIYAFSVLIKVYFIFWALCSGLQWSELGKTYNTQKMKIPYLTLEKHKYTKHNMYATKWKYINKNNSNFFFISMILK